MRTIKRILVAIRTPGQRGVPAAVVKAGQIAQKGGATVELFHALTTSVYVDLVAMQNKSVTAYREQERDECQQRLEKMSARLRKSGVDVSTTVTADFPAYEAIIRHARNTGADLIIADCHRSSHKFASLMRLTDWELLRHSPVPVLLVKSARRYHRPVLLAAVDPSHAFAKPGQLDDSILDAGEELRHLLGGMLHAVHAYSPLPADVRPAQLRNRGINVDLQALAANNARKQLDKAVAGHEISKSRAHLYAGLPQDALRSMQKKLHAQIVIMGAVSRTGLKRLFIGNTAEQVLDVLPCDILIVKSRRFATEVQRASRGTRFRVATGPAFV
ncbi:MAG: universal stress protein [Steroidobacteraceae bacterium]